MLITLVQFMAGNYDAVFEHGDEREEFRNYLGECYIF
jgi:hypothetical protein